jgi:hypothetical protein
VQQKRSLELYESVETNWSPWGFEPGMSSPRGEFTFMVISLSLDLSASLFQHFRLYSLELQ